MIAPSLLSSLTSSRKCEEWSRSPSALNLSLSEADDGDDLFQDLGFGASPPERSHSPEPTTGPSSSKPLTDHIFPKPPSTKPTVPDESAKSEGEVVPSEKKQKGKGKAKADSPTIKVYSHSNSEFKSKSVVDTDDVSHNDFAPKLAHKTIVPKLEARKAEPIASRPGPAPSQDPLRLEYGTAGPSALVDIQSMQSNMNRELPHVACVRCVVTEHDQDCEPLDPNSVPEGIAQNKCVQCNKQNQHCSFSKEANAANNELLKLLAAVSSHHKVVKMLGAEAVRLGNLYVQSLHMVAHSQQTAHLARDTFSDNLTQFVQSGHNPKSVLSALDNGDSTFSPSDEKLLVDFFQWPILPSSGTSGDKAADGEDNDNDDDADRSIDEEAKAPPLVSKTTKTPAATVKESKVKGSKALELTAQDPKAPIASTSGTQTRSGQWGGKPVSTSGANLPQGHKCTVEEEVKAGTSSKRTKVATKEK
ncbi:hypothetical protein L218DRAFT_303608 [Marasmius fiardii PR-910]|nr:hypothetical protein L218DRAFT_303608 [Marasmius fiardii PR-910]